MGNVELMKRSKAVADLAWAAVKVSDPLQTGMYVHHANVAEGDHHYAQAILSGNATAQEYSGVLVDPALIKAANDLVDFFQNHVGWENPPRSSNRGQDAELGIASMIQYQNLIRERQMGIVGDRAEAGMEKLLLNFAGSYPTSQPERVIEAVREKLDPLFEDGLRLSDHQRMSGSVVMTPTQKSTDMEQRDGRLHRQGQDEQIDKLARNILGNMLGDMQRPTNLEQRDGRIIRQEAQQAPAVRNGPRADDPWEMHP